MDDHNADEVPRTDDYDECSERSSTEALDESSTDYNSADKTYSWVPPPSDVDFSKIADVCDLCAHIPWRAFLEDVGPLKSMTRIKESQEVLEQSSCRICRFLRWNMEENNLHGRPYGIERCNRDNEMDQSLLGREACIELATPEGSCHFMLINNTTDDAAFEQRYHHSEEIDAHQISNWVKECETNHGTGCAMDAATQTVLRELRVIDCERRLVVRAPPDCRYTALSYVWGSNACESLQEPPKTIAQSILFTQKLGYRYLWVDRYCINQADKADKHTQVMQMGDIYAAAQITFIAAAGSDAAYGLPGVLPHSRREQKCEMVGAMTLLSLSRLHHLGTVAESEWASRAWTFQEFHRSRRRLIFTDNQIIFVCNSATRYEFAVFPNVSKWERNNEETRWLKQWLPPCNVAKTSDLRNQNAMERATGYIEAYSNRQLSYDSDALNAIAGALDPLFEQFTFHVSAVPYRHAIRYAHKGPGDFEQSSLSALRAEFGSAIVGQRRTYSSVRRGTVIVSGTPNILQKVGELYIARIDQLGFEYSQDTEMALLWFHDQPCRRRPEFASWSPLGWVEKLRWFRESLDYGDVLLASSCGVRFHSRSTTYDISTFVPTKEDALTIKPHCLDVNFSTNGIIIVDFPDKSATNISDQKSCRHVAFKLNSDLAIVLKTLWDTKLQMWDTKHLTGALVNSPALLGYDRCFVIILASRGDYLNGWAYPNFGRFQIIRPSKLARRSCIWISAVSYVDMI